MRSSRSPRRSLPGFAVDMTLRDSRKQRVELTPEQRTAALDKRVKDALEAAAKQRRFFRKWW